MAARPLLATAVQNPFMDLIVSSRPAFVWDGASGAVSWMNAAARERFSLGPSEFSNALPADAAASLASFARVKTKKGVPATGVVSLKLPGKRRVFYSLQRLELAGGAPGAVAVEAGAKAPPLFEPPPVAQPKRKPRKKRAVTSNPVSPASLTPSELRSFKAIGKAVLKLCGAKQAAAAKCIEAPTPCGTAAQYPARSDHSPFAALLAAFDLVLILDDAFAVERCEGRPQRLGWRKLALLGAQAADLFPLSEQEVFRRMTAMTRDEPDGVGRETLLVRDGTGTACPCVAFLGRLETGRSGYFLALLSLKLPQRLKRLQPQVVRPAPPARLAA